MKRFPRCLTVQLDSGDLAVAHGDALDFREQQYLAAVTLDRFGQSIRDDLSAAFRIVGALHVMECDGGVDQERSAARRQAVGAVLGGQDRLQPRVPGAGVEEFAQGGVPPAQEHQRAQHRRGRLGGISHQLGKPVHLAQQGEVAIDPAFFAREEFAEAVAKSLHPLGDPELEVGKDQRVVAVGIQLFELQVVDSRGAQHPSHHSVGLASAEVVDPDVELVASTPEDSGVAAGHHVLIDQQDFFAPAREDCRGGQSADAGAHHDNVEAFVVQLSEAITHGFGLMG